MNRFPGQHSNHGQRPHGKAVFPPGEPTVPTSCCGGLRLGMRPASPPLPPPQSTLTTPSSSFSCPHRTIANICRLSSCKLQRVFVLFTSFHKLRSHVTILGPTTNFLLFFHHLFCTLGHSFPLVPSCAARTATKSPDKSLDGSPDHSAVNYHMPSLRSLQYSAASSFIPLWIASS